MLGWDPSSTCFTSPTRIGFSSWGVHLAGACVFYVVSCIPDVTEQSIGNGRFSNIAPPPPPTHPSTNKHFQVRSYIPDFKAGV
jgi:hypothetical protein